MKLTFDQIKAITFGADHSRINDGHICFFRYSEAAIQTWGQIRGDFKYGASAPAGIRFDFHTDSSRFAFLPTAPAPFDIMIDGMLVSSCRWDYYENTDGWVNCSLPEGEHRVTVLFPHHSDIRINIREMVLDDGATIIPHTYERKILFFGDSITHGTGASSTYMSYAWRVSQALNADCRNLAIGGSFFAPKAFPEDLDFEPDIIIVAYGTNDWGFFSGPDRLELRSREFLDKLCSRFPNKKIFGITPIWRCNHKELQRVGTFEECRQIVRQAHQNHGITVIEGNTLVPHQYGFFTDGLHPNDNGHSCYAENLLVQMRPYLTK